MRHLPFSSQRIYFSFNIFISNTNTQALLVFVSAAAAVAAPLSTFVSVSDEFVYSRSVFPPQPSPLGHLRWEWKRPEVCVLHSDGEFLPPPSRGARHTARRQCCHAPGWLHRSGRCGVYGVVRGINKTFCTMSMNKFDSLPLCCTFMTIFASIRVPTLGFNCGTCRIHPFGIDLQAGLGLEAA